jgi:hypothetical protein
MLQHLLRENELIISGNPKIMDFGTGTCVVCNVEDRSAGQVTEFDDSCGFFADHAG